MRVGDWLWLRSTRPLLDGESASWEDILILLMMRARYHVRACVVAGVGFFTDSYDIFAVGLLTTMLGIVYW
jgi:hypothetical protein